jgi:hypothetical protein
MKHGTNEQEGQDDQPEDGDGKKNRGGYHIVVLFYYTDIILTMAKQRKTRKQKLMSRERQERQEGFVIKDEWLTSGSKKPQAKVEFDPGEKKFFRSDLTKTGILTMLVLALELAIWSYLSRH